MQGILQSKDMPQLPSRNVFLQISLQKQGLRWQSEIYKDGWNEIHAERNGKDKSLLLHCLFFHNHVTLPHSYRAALASQNNTFSTFRTYFSAFQCKEQHKTQHHHLFLQPKHIVNIPMGKQSPKKWIHLLKSSHSLIPQSPVYHCPLCVSGLWKV